MPNIPKKPNQDVLDINLPKPYLLRVYINGIRASKTYATLEQAIQVRDEHYKDRAESEW